MRVPAITASRVYIPCRLVYVSLAAVTVQPGEPPVKFDTKVVHAGITPDPTTGSIVPPIFQTATYVLDEVGKDKGFDYTRSANPTRQVLEANLAAIEGGAHGVC